MGCEYIGCNGRTCINGSGNQSCACSGSQRRIRWERWQTPNPNPNPIHPQFTVGIWEHVLHNCLEQTTATGATCSKPVPVHIFRSHTSSSTGAIHFPESVSGLSVIPGCDQDDGRSETKICVCVCGSFARTNIILGMVVGAY